MLMSHTTRYMLRQLVLALIVITLVLTFAVWLTQSLRFVDLIVNRGLSVGAFFYFVLLLMPSLLVAILPIAAFIAVMFVYNRMLSDSELVVLRAAGFGHFRLARPAFLLAGGVCVILMALNFYLLPMSYRAFKTLQFSFRSEIASILQQGVFNTVDEGITVYVRDRSAEGDLYGIFAHDSRDPEKPVTTTAERGKLVITAEGHRVLMANGLRQEFDRERGTVTSLEFETYTMDLGTLAETLDDRFLGPRERNLDELFRAPQTVADEVYRNELIAEGHARIAAPFYPVAFVMIGLATLLATEFNRRARIWRLVAAGVMVGALKLSEIGLQSVARSEPAAYPLLYANVVLPAAVAAYLLYRHNRRRPRRRRTAEMAPT